MATIAARLRNRPSRPGVLSPVHLHRLPLTTLLPLALGLSTLAYHGPGHTWARAHAGDALAVACLAGLLGAFTAWSQRFRYTAIALFSTAIELAQLSSHASERGTLARLLIGSHFDPLDFVYYAIGLGAAWALEHTADALLAPPLK